MARIAVAARVFVATLLVYVATAGGSLTSSDAVVAFDVTKNLCEHGSLAYSGELLGMDAHRGVDGRYYAPFGVAQSVYNIPFYLAGRSAQRLLGVRLGRADSVPKAAVSLGGTVVAAACVALTWLLALEVSGAASVAFGAAALFGFATVFWPYSKFGFNAPLATCCLLAGTLGVWSGVHRRRVLPVAAGGLAFGVAMLTRHELVIALVPAAVFLAVAHPRSRLVVNQAAAGAAGFAVGFGAWMALNVVRFGNPLNPGYLGDPNPAFGSSVAWGLYGLLASPSSSLLLYCPVVLLAVPALVAWWREDRAATVLFAGLFVTLLAFYAQLGNWVGGRSYGPRYLVPALPFLAIAAARWLQKQGRGVVRTVAWALCALSVTVQLPGVLVDYSKVSVAWARLYAAGTVPDRRVTWSASPLLLNTKAAMEAVPRNARYVAGLDAPPRAAAGPAESRDFAQQFAFSLDFWWLYLFYLGAWGRAAALCAGLAPLALGSALGWRTWKGSQTQDEKRETRNVKRETRNEKRKTRNEKRET
jgi:hypothetical protein